MEGPGLPCEGALKQAQEQADEAAQEDVEAARTARIALAAAEKEMEEVKAAAEKAKEEAEAAREESEQAARAEVGDATRPRAIIYDSTVPKGTNDASRTNPSRLCLDHGSRDPSRDVLDACATRAARRSGRRDGSSFEVPVGNENRSSGATSQTLAMQCHWHPSELLSGPWPTPQCPDVSWHPTVAMLEA